MNRRRFVALDRDGTIIAERQYLSSPDEVELLPGAGSGLRAMRELGLGLVIVTNQSAVGGDISIWPVWKRSMAACGNFSLPEA